MLETELLDKLDKSITRLSRQKQTSELAVRSGKQLLTQYEELGMIRNGPCVCFEQFQTLVRQKQDALKGVKLAEAMLGECDAE